MNKVFVCSICMWTPTEDEISSDWHHCPNCLMSYHEVDGNGFECGGRFEAVSVWVQESGDWELIQRCHFCGEFQHEAVCEDDNPFKLLSLVSEIIAQPPFPIERMEELTYLMGGQGDVKGYYHE